MHEDLDMNTLEGCQVAYERGIDMVRYCSQQIRSTQLAMVAAHGCLKRLREAAEEAGVAADEEIVFELQQEILGLEEAEEFLKRKLTEEQEELRVATARREYNLMEIESRQLLMLLKRRDARSDREDITDEVAAYARRYIKSEVESG